MEVNEKPPDDFFKGIKTSLKSVLKHPDINHTKITNAGIKCNKISATDEVSLNTMLYHQFTKIC